MNHSALLLKITNEGAVLLVHEVGEDWRDAFWQRRSTDGLERSRVGEIIFRIVFTRSAASLGAQSPQVLCQLVREWAHIPETTEIKIEDIRG